MTRQAQHLASFYHMPEGNLGGLHCRGTACFAARAQNPAGWQSALAQEARLYCLGKCYAAPATLANNIRPKIEIRSKQTVLLEMVANGGAQGLAVYGSYTALQQALRQTPQAIVDMVEQSGLRGRGGAAFSTGKKWRAVAMQTQPQKFIVANADEGDPGAFSDRFLMEDDPHSLVEAMLIAAYAVGAQQGYIYLRKEYPLAQIALQQALDEARAAGLLGAHILGSILAFDIKLIMGQGSYVCGEETALLNSIEDKRPEVRARPPYPTQHGLYGKPTLINNVETLAAIPWIVRHGAAAYRALGFSSSRGTKLISLNSLFCNPGLYEVEFGISLRSIVEDIGGGLKTGTLRGLMIGGPLAGLVPPHLLDTPFAYEELHAIGAAVGHGGIIAFDERTSIAELVHHVFDFGAYESCGKCTPCRLGSREIEQMFRRILSGSHEDKIVWDETVSALGATSLCGHGGGLAEFARSIARHYPEELAQCFA